jgi:hypothetical protein
MSSQKKYHVVQFQSYTSPTIVEQPNKDWIEYGDDNNYFQYLIDMYYGSPTNNACIKGTADMIFGQGPEVVKADRHLQGYLDFKMLFSDEDVKKAIMDLKLLGMAAFQVVKSKNKQRYAKAYHFPMQTLRPQRCNERGEVEKWYYVADWSKLKRGEKPKEFFAFGYDESANECMLVIKPYSTGQYYFSPPDYQGGTQYVELEGEISNYHLNNIKNGLAPSMLINFNNGEPPEETKDTIEAQINDKFGGSSNTGRAIISFNDSKETAADITAVQLSDAHNQYQFLSTECIDKILLAHRITSPLIFGVKNVGSGFSSNSDELKTGLTVFENIVVRPFQQMLVEAFNKVLIANGHQVEIYFKTLKPLEFVDYGNNVVDETTKEKESGVALSLNKHAIAIDMTENDEHFWLQHLQSKGERINSDEWEIIDVQSVNYEEFQKRFRFSDLGDYADPDLKSADDKGIYKIRYRYGPDEVSDKSRNFCVQMVAETKSGIVYRREDIDEMSLSGVNGQFAPKGKSTYSIFRFKGGVNCHHAWERVTYRRKYQEGKGQKVLPLEPNEKGTDVRDMDNYIDVPNSSADSSGVPFDPPNWQEATTKPIDMPNKGGLKK